MSAGSNLANDDVAEAGASDSTAGVSSAYCENASRSASSSFLSRLSRLSKARLKASAASARGAPWSEEGNVYSAVTVPDRSTPSRTTTSSD